MYFSSMFFVYGSLSLLMTVMEIVVILAFNVPAFTNPYALTVTLFLLVLFILPCLLFSAAFSYLFDRMETSQSVFSQVSIRKIAFARTKNSFSFWKIHFRYLHGEGQLLESL
jgi:hypothetical protein